MGIVRGGDQVFRIYDPLLVLKNIAQAQWVHVVNQEIDMDHVTVNSKITSLVPEYHLAAGVLPLARLVEQLIDVTIEGKGGSSDTTAQSQICKSIVECLEDSKF